MVFVVAAVVGFAFGGADQYLGGLMTPGLWTVSLSQLSAPWLVLPFLVGCSQTRRRRAALAGLVATLSGLAGYFLMIMRPTGAGPWNINDHEIHYVLMTNVLYVAGGFVTAPIYGWAGQRWRTHRAWASAALVTGALCCEPFVLKLIGRRYPGDEMVWPVEILIGIALAALFLTIGVAYRRHGNPELGGPTAT